MAPSKYPKKKIKIQNPTISFLIPSPILSLTTPTIKSSFCTCKLLTEQPMLRKKLKPLIAYAVVCFNCSNTATRSTSLFLLQMQ